jgi:hypothetical protein
MYSPKEKEIIERCLSISAWNYRVSKFEMAGKKTEASILREKVRKELTVLMKLADDLLSAKISDTREKIKSEMSGGNGRRISRFFGRLIGRDLV